MKITNIKSLYSEIKKNRNAVEKIISDVRTGNFEGFTPPSTLIGAFNYPRVSVGVMFTMDQSAYLYDSPKYWVKNGYDVSKIFSMRTLLVNAKELINVKKPNGKFIESISFATMAKNDLAVGLGLSKIGAGGIVSDTIAPHGITATLSSFKINENVKIEKPVEKVYYDRDLRATEGITYLYESGIDDNKISKILSVGALGISRKLVPTKWSITAVDDILGKKLIDEIKLYNTGDECFVRSGTVLGNHFTFIFMTGNWSFELLEAGNKDGNNLLIGESDYELFDGRKEYVSNTAGAYYAIRLAVLEKLKKLKRQFSVLVIREITPDYFVPLGVWVVREGARKVLDSDPEQVGELANAIKTAKKLTIYPIDFDRRSKLIYQKEKQNKLTDF
ncbi:hypothetical protein M1316_01760 [Candidatus Parvarchaeota archaeon]|nr:hypothetical protein [Candidatus Parvarchaeota archaeon]